MWQHPLNTYVDHSSILTVAEGSNNIYDVVRS